jgi:hypothetical protein
MSERDGYEPGVPCWVAAVEPGDDFLCRLRGRDVAAIVAPQGPRPPQPAWGTYVSGELQQPVSRDVVAAMRSGDQQAAAIGGRVVAGPYDVPGFRQAVLADPQSAEFTVSQLVTASQGA